MTGTWISWAIEGMVVVLLALTICYCILLNSRLKRLKSDELGLRKTITELVLATEIAERAINGLKQAAVDCDKTLARRVREAEYFSVEIAREIGEGSAVLDRIAQITAAARGEPVAGRAPEAITVRAAPQAPGQLAAPQASGHVAALARAEELRMKAQQSSERLASLRRATTEEAA